MEIPEYRYPLYSRWDRECYSTIRKLAKKFPKIKGNKKEVDRFLKILIQNQKIEDWRKLFKIIFGEMRRREIDVEKINQKIKDFKIPKGIEKWAFFTQDKRLCKYIDKLGERKIHFKGTDKEISEFIFRFILSQLLYDWRTPLFATILEINNKRTAKIEKLNELLKQFDYTKIFM